jgi:predicted aspartyl protease
MGEEKRTDALTRRAFTGLLTAAALTPAAMARAQDPNKIVVQQNARTAGQATPTAGALLDTPAVTTLKAAADAAERMTVPVMLNGQGPFPFVVDTGSNRSVVADTIAQQLQLPSGGMIQVSSATGVDVTPSARIAKLSVGKREVSNILAPVLYEANLGCAGMLGIDAVSDQSIIMDFKAWTIRIQPSSRVDDDPNAVVVRGRSRYGQLILVDSWAEGVPLYVIIDTGGELTIGNSVLRNTLARRRAQTPQLVQVKGVTGGEVSADLSLLSKVSLGNVIVRNLQIGYTDLHAFDQFGLRDKPAMLLGMSTLRLFRKVWIDFKARQVRFLFDSEARDLDHRGFADEPRFIQPG